MMNKYTIALVSAVMLVSVGLAGCDKKKSPIETDDPTTSSATKTENDLYIEKLNKDVKVEDPDALLDEVNKDTSSK